MRIFTRYILREVTSYALLGGVVFTFVLFMPNIGKVLDLVVRESASFTDALSIFAYTLPNTLTFTIPTAVLAGVLLGLSRLASDSEITAMRACGIGATAFVRIVSLLAVAAFALGVVNALYFAPRAAAGLLHLEDSLKSSQASFVVQPRVFYEDFKNYVLFVQDVDPGAGSSKWRHVFLANLTDPASPHITTASEAVIAGSSEASQNLTLNLLDGGQHQISPNDPNQYEITTFASTNVPLQFESQDDTHISRLDTPLHALSLQELWRRTRAGSLPNLATVPAVTPIEARAARIELNARFSYPFACLVLMLIGVPLGLSSKRGGKSTGFILTLLLVVGYYLLSDTGIALAKNGKLTPLLGVWGANLIFAAFGILLLQQLGGGGYLLYRFTAIAASLGKAFAYLVNPILRIVGTTLRQDAFSSDPIPPRRRSDPDSASYEDSRLHPRPTLFPRLRGLFKTNFPLLLDEYVMRAYATNFALSLVTFAILVLIFTFFELIGDIIRNQTPFIIVGEYLFNLVPYIINSVTPLCSLLAVLITFGALNRSSELTAMKASGISLYRVVAPILVVAALLTAALFAFDEAYLPDANRRQEALRAVIKSKPAQTFLRPDRKWISGQTPADSRSDPDGTPTRIFYYQAFDPTRAVFANLTVFEFEPATFTLQRRIFATSVRWDATVNRWIFDNGWQRTFARGGDTVASYQPFTVSTFPEIHEQPAYFTKEEKQSQEMSYGELTHYIADLRQSGFNTIPFTVQLQRKLADPAVTLVMAILAVPFALSMGKRGGLAGIATAIGIAIAYWVTAAVFSAMGDIATLPPTLAAWSPDILFGLSGTYLLLRTPT